MSDVRSVRTAAAGSGGTTAEEESASAPAGHDADLDHVVHLEQVLLDPEVRADGDRVAALLHPDFVEHGASGRIWDRDGVVEALPVDPVVVGEAGDFAPVRLAEDVVLLWLLRFHQGTLVPPDG